MERLAPRAATLLASALPGGVAAGTTLTVHTGQTLRPVTHADRTTASGATARQWTDNGTADHLWKLTPR